MRGSRSVLLIVTLLLSVLFVLSCGRIDENSTVAKVADRVITLGIFEQTYWKVDPKYRPEDKGIDGLKEFLNTMINKDVMAIKAGELGYDKDPYVVQAMEAFKKVSLPAAYLKLRVADKIKVTEKDLKDAYELYHTNVQIKQILTDTKAQGEEAYKLLQEGADFESVCQRYSKDPDAGSGGRVGTAVWGMFEPELQDALFSAPVGGVTPPIEMRYGYIIFKVLEKNQPKRKPFEEAKSELEKLLQRLEEIRLTNQVSDQVRVKHNFKWHDDNLGVAFDALPPDRPLTTPPDRNAEVYPLLRFDERDLDKPLVSYDSKTITVRDFSDLFDKASFFTRPRREFRYGDVKRFLMEVVMNELVVVEMRDAKIEEEPVVITAFAKKQEQFMVDKMYQELIDKQTDITPDEVTAYYNDNLERFRRSEERRLGMILAGSKERADEARKKIMAGEPFDTVSAQYSTPDLTREERVGTQFVSKGQNPDFDDAAFAIENVGDLSPAFETTRGWMVVKLLERRPEKIMELEDATDSIRQSLKVVKNEARLKSLLDKWRTEIDIKIYDKVLLKANVQEKPMKSLRSS